MKSDKNFHLDEELKHLFDSYKVDFKLQENQEKTIEVLKGYIAHQKQPSPIQIMKTLFKKTWKELLATCKPQFTILMIVILLFIPLLESNINEYLLLFFTAPLPLVIGFWNLIGKSEPMMIELEKTFKYSFFQMLFSRVIITLVTSIVFLTLLLIQIIGWGNNQGIHGLFSLIMWGLTPLLLFSVILLMIITISPSRDIILISFLIWILFGFATISTSIGNAILHVNIAFYILLNLLLSILMFFQLKRLFRFTRKDSIRNEA